MFTPVARRGVNDNDTNNDDANDYDDDARRKSHDCMRLFGIMPWAPKISILTALTLLHPLNEEQLFTMTQTFDLESAG